MHPRNLLSDLPQTLLEEQMDNLVNTPHTRLLRIVSPPHFRSIEFRQPEDEWVLVLQGEATLELDNRPLQLFPGDSLLIPAGTPHRVIDTSATPRCVWLALHLDTATPATGGDR